MSIQVTLEYRDNNIHIKRGLYADNSNELQGLGEYLLNAGHAKYSNEFFASVESPTPKELLQPFEDDVPNELELLRARYKDLSGKKAYHAWDESKLREKIDSWVEDTE